MSFPIPDDAAPSEIRAINALDTYCNTLPADLGVVKEERMAAIRDIQKVRDANQRERALREYAGVYKVKVNDPDKLDPADAPQFSLTVSRDLC